jgi:ketosteroid isomerase-like protein
MNSRHSLSAVISAALGSTNLLKATVVSLALLPAMSLADNQRAAIDALIDGLHQDAHEGNFHTYFDRYTPDAVFLGTDKSERWTIDQFKVYAEPAFEDGHGWTYSVKERNWEGEGSTRWFDEVLLNEKLGHCRGTGVVELIDGEWKIAHYALTMLVPNEIAAEVGAQTQRADGI